MNTEKREGSFYQDENFKKKFESEILPKYDHLRRLQKKKEKHILISIFIYLIGLVILFKFAGLKFLFLFTIVMILFFLSNRDLRIYLFRKKEIDGEMFQFKNEIIQAKFNNYRLEVSEKKTLKEIEGELGFRWFRSSNSAVNKHMIIGDLDGIPVKLNEYTIILMDSEKKSKSNKSSSLKMTVAEYDIGFKEDFKAALLNFANIDIQYLDSKQIKLPNLFLDKYYQISTNDSVLLNRIFEPKLLYEFEKEGKKTNEQLNEIINQATGMFGEALKKATKVAKYTDQIISIRPGLYLSVVFNNGKLYLISQQEMLTDLDQSIDSTSEYYEQTLYTIKKMEDMCRLILRKK